jgi:hypothetical protein
VRRVGERRRGKSGAPVDDGGSVESGFGRVQRSGQVGLGSGDVGKVWIGRVGCVLWVEARGALEAAAHVNAAAGRDVLKVLKHHGG